MFVQFRTASIKVVLLLS